MFLGSQETLTVHHQDRVERTEIAARDRIAIRMARIQRTERWARRLTRLSARLETLARVQRARLS